MPPSSTVADVEAQRIISTTMISDENTSHFGFYRDRLQMLNNVCMAIFVAVSIPTAVVACGFLQPKHAEFLSCVWYLLLVQRKRAGSQVEITCLTPRIGQALFDEIMIQDYDKCLSIACHPRIHVGNA
ncbi:hypothetical protein PSPO01_06144 [Paraphaeosphaeria sporulosa]